MSEYIDKIIYINLEKRNDRKTQIENELKLFEIDAERYNAIENKTGIIGCTESHLNILKLAKERNYKNILILEDDFTFIVSKKDFEDNLRQFFESKAGLDYDVCMISYYIIKHEELKEYKFINKIIEAQTASGYLVNCKYYDKLINILEYGLEFLIKTGEHWNYANDQIWKKLQPKDNWYYFTTRLGKQRPSYSDTANCFSDYSV